MRRARPGVHRAERHRSAIRTVEAFTLTSDRAFPRHAHDEFGIGVLDAGAHRSWSGVGRVEAVAGDVITVNPGEMHDGDPVAGQARSWRMLYLAPRLLALADERCEGVEIARPVLPDPRLAAGFAVLFAALTAPVPDPLAAEEGLVRMLADLLARHGSRPLRVRGPPPSVARALQRLTDSPAQPITLTELAGLSGISRFQLLRGFKRELGVTPHAFLLQHRVRLARRLLAAGWRPAEAAAEAGFADQSHLTRAFHRQLGLTPGRYRAALA